MKTADFLNVLIQSGIFGVLLSLFLSGVKCAKTYLAAKAAEATSNIKDLNIKNAVQSAEDCVTTVVLEMAQTTVDDLKAKSADGKLTGDEAKEVLSDATSKVQSLISIDVFNTLDTVFGDANAWIKSKIEAAVKKIKQPTLPQQ
jgi:hypothetical protein